MPKKYRNLLLALAAIASIYLVKATGLDQGLINAALDAAIEAVVEEAPAEVETSKIPFDQISRPC